MISSNLSKQSRSQTSITDQQKKQKGSLMMKILIKNKIVSMLSHQPRKLMKLAKKGNLVYKNMQQHTLLPKLTLTHLFPQIEDLNRRNQQHHAQFYEVNKELNCSMILFERKFNLVSQQQQGRILNIQTQKCYSHIPQYFFTQPTQEQLQSMLTRNKRAAEQLSFDLIDYSDQIEYNINQQVSYKMKVFLDFADFLQALAGLVDISCQKIQTSRKRSNIVREIIVQKSINIKVLRVKQNSLGECIRIMEQLKKVKQMQRSLMSLIHAKGKISVGDIYQKYCKQHEKIRQFCCKKGLCNFGDIRYYVERNYQETFNKSLQDYLSEMTKIDKKKLIQILKPNKAVYVSSQIENRSELRSGEKVLFGFDESGEWEEEFQLTVKSNIQKEITNIFELGLEKCTYSTDSLCAYLKQQLQQLQLTVYSVLLQNQQAQKQDMLDNFVNFALNRPTQSCLQVNIADNLLTYTQKSQIINKISMVKFVQVVELLSNKFMELTIRCFSVINELMRVLVKLQMKQPQKQEIICAYLIQILMLCMSVGSNCVGMMVQLREVKETEVQLADKLIACCEQWEEFVDEAEVKYEHVWRKLTFYLSDHASTNNVNTRASHGDQQSIRNSFQHLQQFVRLNYKQSHQQLDISHNEDTSQQLISKQEMKLKLLNEIVHAKNQKLNFNFYALTKLVINKSLLKVIESQTWTAISISSSKIENTLGYLLYGQKYLNRQDSQNDTRNFLSKSLLLQKSIFKKKSDQSIPPPQQDFDIQTTQKYIKIGQRCFKIVGVTEYILQVVYLFFLYFDKYSFEEQRLRIEQKEKNKQRENDKDKQKENMPEKSFQPPRLRLTTLINKTLQVVNILTSRIRHYVNNLKDLQKRVKSFAKFLLLIYMQLDFFRTIMCSIITQNQQKGRFPITVYQKHTEKQLLQLRKSSLKQLDQCMNQIIKKYNSIGYQKIRQSIKKLQFNPKNPIKNPSQTTSQILAYFSKSLQIIRDIIIDKRLFWKFLNCPWIKLYLEKVNQQSSQIRKFVLKSNGSTGGRRIEDIEWEDKLDWKAKELKWLLTAIDNQGYAEYIKDIGLLEEELRKVADKIG